MLEETKQPLLQLCQCHLFMPLHLLLTLKLYPFLQPQLQDQFHWRL